MAHPEHSEVGTLENFSLRSSEGGFAVSLQISPLAGLSSSVTATDTQPSVHENLLGGADTNYVLVIGLMGFQR